MGSYRWQVVVTRFVIFFIVFRWRLLICNVSVWMPENNFPTSMSATLYCWTCFEYVPNLFWMVVVFLGNHSGVKLQGQLVSWNAKSFAFSACGRILCISRNSFVSPEATAYIISECFLQSCFCDFWAPVSGTRFKPSQNRLIQTSTSRFNGLSSFLSGSVDYVHKLAGDDVVCPSSLWR